MSEGHAESQTVQLMIKKAKVAELSATLSLTDAERLTSMDHIRFPTLPQTAIQKLYAWSVFIDIFPGNAHPVATNVRNFVKAVGPGLHVIYSQAAVPATGMDRVNRVLYEASTRPSKTISAGPLGPLERIVPLTVLPPPRLTRSPTLSCPSVCPV
jgi:hypothetical protein